MKLVTYNIRYDCGHDGKNNFSCRKPLILDKLRREAPDIVCFQEVLPHVAAWLKETLQDYYIVGCPREAGLTGEQTCIAFRYDRFSLMQMHTLWLSPTPTVPGSRYAVQSICPRTCTAVTLLENATGKVFRVLNTHLDHEGAPARVLGAQQILAYLEQDPFFPQAPAILAGDMNAEPDSEEMRLLSASLRCETQDIGPTFHNFGRGENVQIDYIFTRGHIACTRLEKWTDCENGVYLSDHYPICAELTL